MNRTASPTTFHHCSLESVQIGATAASGIIPRRVPDTTHTDTKLTLDVHDCLREVRDIDTGITETAQTTTLLAWQRRTQDRVGTNTVALLDDLAELGFSWRDIARMIGVSVPAVQKWRKGDKASGVNHRKIAELLGGCDMIITFYWADDVGQWFEVPIIDGAPVTPIDLWSHGHQQLVLDYAAKIYTPTQTMDSFDSDWRERFRSDFETFLGEDGHLSIRPKDQ
jgi:transcriptional regulator with XRE-family HTH domain